MNGERWKKGRTRRWWFLHDEILVFVVVVNPTVSLISRPTAIRFAPCSSVSSVGRAATFLSFSISLVFRLILPQLSPFRVRADGRANGADRNSGGLERKAIEGRFLRVVARGGGPRRAEDDLSLFSLESRPGLEWNSIARCGAELSK